MDSHAEHIVSNAPSLRDTIIKIFIVILALFIGLSSAILFMPIGIMFAFLIFYFAYYLLTSFFNIEYEYIVTNGELDIDKIIAKKRRKNLLTVKASSFEAFGKFKNISEDKADTVCKVSGDSENEEYFAEFNHPVYGKTLLIFSPNEKIIEALKPYIPKSRWK